jgi:hypothetical protein
MFQKKKVASSVALSSRFGRYWHKDKSKVEICYVMKKCENGKNYFFRSSHFLSRGHYLLGHSQHKVRNFFQRKAGMGIKTKTQNFT